MNVAYLTIRTAPMESAKIRIEADTLTDLIKALDHIDHVMTIEFGEKQS